MENARRRRFIAYFDTVLKGSRERLMDKTGLTKGRISQLFDEKQAFGDVAARRLAERLKLPPDYFERDQSGGDEAGLSQQAIELGREFDRMTLEERQLFMRLMRASRSGPDDSQWRGGMDSLKKAG